MGNRKQATGFTAQVAIPRSLLLTPCSATCRGTACRPLVGELWVGQALPLRSALSGQQKKSQLAA